MSSMKVWVVTSTDPDNYGMQDIFDSAEAAKAAYPHIGWELDNGRWYPDGWYSRGEHDLVIYEHTVRTLDTVRPSRS